MIAILCVIDFLWGLVIFSVFNTLKKWVESTKSLPLGAVINLLGSSLLAVAAPCGIILPIVAYIIAKNLFKSPNHGDVLLWGSLSFWGGILAYAFLKRNAIKLYIQDVHQRESTHDTPSEQAIEIIEKDWRCRKCGTPQKYPYERNSPMYGSLLFICSKCGTQQIDYGRLEPALDRSFGNWNVRHISIKVNVISFVVSMALLILILNIPVSHRYILCGLLFCTTTALVSSVIITIESLLKKKPDFIKKSEARLQNKDYVALLRKHGYEVPHKWQCSNR